MPYVLESKELDTCVRLSWCCPSSRRAVSYVIEQYARFRPVGQS